MLNEKHPDSFVWRKKLEALDTLPGEEIIDKQAAWEKLHVRLQEKPRRKKMIWYWAAACLLLALLIQWMVAVRKEATFVNNTLPNDGQKIFKDTSLPVPLKELVAEKIFDLPEKQMKTNDGKKNRIFTPTNNNIVKAKEPAVTTTVDRQIFTEAIESVQVPDTPITVIAKVVPAKKKMRLVHINEIEGPMDQFTFSFQREERIFTSRLGNNNINNDNAPPQREYTGVLKIKISSKN